MPTITTIPVIILLLVLWRCTNGQILSCVLFTSVFTAASVMDFGVIGVAPWLFALAAGLAFKLVAGYRGYRLTSGANKVALHLMVVFLVYAAFTGLVYPLLFRGVTVMRTGDPEPLAWGLSNLAQLFYLLAAAVLYFLAISSTAEELRQALQWYVRGCITAAAFAMYQLLNAILHVPYPDAMLYSNKAHVVYRAYMISGVWRLNSTFSEASEMAGFLIVGLALMGWTMLTSPFSIKRCLYFTLVLVSLIMTLSSVGYLCLAYTLVLGAAFYLRHIARCGGISAGKMIAGMLLLSATVGVFVLDHKAAAAVDKVITSTLLEKQGSDSYRERNETHVAAIETLKQTGYLGAGWGSVRASGLPYVLIGTVGVPGALIFLAFLASLFLPLARRGSGDAARRQRDLIEMSLVAASTLLLAMMLAGAEPVAPVLWVLFGVATVALPSHRRRVALHPSLQTMSPSMDHSVSWPTDPSLNLHLQDCPVVPTISSSV